MLPFLRAGLWGALGLTSGFGRMRHRKRAVRVQPPTRREKASDRTVPPGAGVSRLLGIPPDAVQVGQPPVNHLGLLPTCVFYAPVDARTIHLSRGCPPVVVIIGLIPGPGGVL